MKKNKQHSNKTGFQVPKDYFENFEENFLEQCIENLQQTTPLPPTTESGFSIPKDYFENFESQLPPGKPTRHPDHYFSHFEANLGELNSTMWMKLPQDLELENQSSKIRSLFTSKTVLLYSGIAALITLLFTLYTPQKELVDMNSIAITEIQTYIDEDHLFLSTTEIENILSENTTSIDSLDINTISNDQLVEYLSEEQIEETIIFIE